MRLYCWERLANRQGEDQGIGMDTTWAARARWYNDNGRVGTVKESESIRANRPLRARCGIMSK